MKLLKLLKKHPEYPVLISPLLILLLTLLVIRLVDGGYIRYDSIALVWVISSLVGFYVAGWHIKETFLDWRAARKAKAAAEQHNVVITELVSEFMRILVHLVFVALGLVTMFVPPNHLGSTTWVQILTWSFILLPAWIALQSIFALAMRRALERILDARSK